MKADSIEKQYNELLKTLQAYQAALNEAAIVSITDLRGKIVYANRNFLEVSQYTADELLGQTHSIVNSGYHSPAYFKRLWDTITSGKPWRGEMKNKAKDGSFFWVDTVITPVMDKHNRVFQYLAVRNVITAQKENEKKLMKFQRELIKREQQLKDAQRVARTGSWHIDPHNKIEWSEETYRIFEIPVGTPMAYEFFLERVHPADRQRIDVAWQRALKGAPYEVEHRITTAHGEKWVKETARIEFDEAHNLKSATGTAQDITERKKIEDILKESETLYKNVFNNSPFPKAILDKETFRFLEVNKTAIEVYGYSRQEFLKLTGFDIRVDEEHARLREQLAGEYTWDKSIRTHKKKNGDLMLVEPYIAEICYKGKPAYLITINDVTEKLKMQEQLILSKITRQKEINRASMEAQEQNRAEIGRELHDNINQLLVASTLYLKNIRPVTASEKSCLEKSLEITASAINEIRKLSRSLVPPSLGNVSLKESIEELFLNFELTQTVIEFNIHLVEDRLSDGLKIAIYRVIQEQFNNIIKYAEASRVKISIWQDDHLLCLEITDNGKGFDMKQKPRGIGLTNIAHRVETYNGKLSINSSPGRGCRLYIEIVL